ncbi:hypothetical protein C9I98_26210 [Photobacterium sanctipauli]|uniref:DUF4145 domain-containing protein n=1 Tax=Photobacterium sanctipauli TaxID=1342794 RepID=A0A2T3N7E8_9GAMM|nr:hypothetical protein [Photobacterium sanctipauli]PSW08902.1 hypothetical protein C9I98_26210 [Photobacterium sanctipauli]
MHQKLMSVLLNEDELGAVIRAHMALEQDVDRFVSLVATNSDYIEKMQIDFSNKLKLAVAFGLDEEIYKPLVSVTNIRNKFAHRADMQLSKSEVNNFYKSFTSEDQALIQEVISNNPDRPPGLSKKYSLLSVKEQFVVMVFYLAIRLWHEVEIELEYILEQVEESTE